MDCPACGTPLVTYRLADREAPVCEQCGHVGIEAEHRPKRDRIESWSEALGRFYGSADAGNASAVPVRAADWNDPSPRQRVETWTEALERFYGTPGAETPDGRETDGETTEPTPAAVAFDGPSAVRQSDVPE